MEERKDQIASCAEVESQLEIAAFEDYDLEGVTILDILDTIHTASLRSKLSGELWEEYESEFRFLRLHTGLNNKQLVILACLCEAGDGLSWRGLGNELGLSRLKTMSLTPDIEDMKDKRWIIPYKCHERGGVFDGFIQVPGIITAFRENRDFVPEDLHGFTEQEFVDRLIRYLAKEGNNNCIPNDAKSWWMLYFAQCNPDLPLCRTVLNLDNKMSQIFLLRIVADYAYYAGELNEGLRVSDINDMSDDDWMIDEYIQSFIENSNDLISRGLIEYACIDGMVDQDLLRLTREAREKLLPEYVLVKRNRREGGRTSDRDLMKCDSIKAKELFYDSFVKKQIDRVTELLSAEGFPLVQHRLENLAHRKGCAVLFYGTPGTGKTETVLQLARRTGRDVMQVNIASIRDKFVGETEKNIKGIFVRYRELCRSSKQIPILLFNEADALINSRFDTTRSSVEKMDNAMQNIILQEMENLDGILIATTNLTGTLDKAFDRRFLFKIEFTKPSIEAQSAIWINKLPHLDMAEALLLSRDFDFSGGQIENIARKCEISYVISGKYPSFEQLGEFCREENINRSPRVKIGF